MAAKPGPPSSSWDHRIATVALSARRRRALQEFAATVRPGMTKAEALYELIDRASIATTAPAENREAEEARAIAMRSTQALESVAAALAPLLSASGDEGGCLQSAHRMAGEMGESGSTTPENALAPRAWLDGAMRRLGQSASELALSLMCVEIKFDAGTPTLRFAIDRIEVAGKSRYRANAALPLIEIATPLRLNDPDLGIKTLTAGVRLRALACPGGWDCQLSSTGNSTAPPLFTFRC